MRSRDKTIKELLHLREELKQAKEEEKDGALYQLVDVYQQLFRKISADRNSEYKASLPDIKRQLIHYLVQYGTYLKTGYEKDYNAAGINLKKAIQYERNLPIAHYRLGFLSYKDGFYTSALQHFQDAIHYQLRTEEMEYKMNDQQIYHCQMYLANSSLFIAEKVKESLKGLGDKVDSEAVLPYETSPYYELIARNDERLAVQAYQFITRDGMHYGPKEECDRKRDLENTVILDTTGRDLLLIFNGREVTLYKDKMEMLRLFLMKSKEDSPITRRHVFDLYSGKAVNGEMPLESYRQNVSRLRAKIKQAGIDEEMIETTSFRGELAYFYNHRFPYLIMHHSDESFILE